LIEGLVAPLAWLSFACFVVAGLALIALHVLPSSADPVADGVSAYALGPSVRVYQANVVSSGLGGLCLAAASAGLAASPVAIVALLGYGLTRIAIAVYPTDARGAALTRTGLIHAILAAIAFLSLALAAPFATASLSADVATGGVATLLAVLAAVVTLTSLGSFAVAALPKVIRFYGVAQRAFYVAGFTWALTLTASIAIS
jgi:hypothetical protein